MASSRRVSPCPAPCRRCFLPRAASPPSPCRPPCCWPTRARWSWLPGAAVGSPGPAGGGGPCGPAGRARPGGWGPPLAAVAAGWSAVALAALPVGPLGAALLPSTPGPRLYGATYLLIGPWDEAAKPPPLVLLLLPTEPVRRPRDGLVAALLLGAGFGMAENLVYVGAAPEPFMLALLRALVPGHLIVAPFAALGLHAALQRRERALSIWPGLALGWLAAALAPGAFDHGALVLASYMAPPDVKEDTVRHALGLTPAGVRGLP